jgi:hypothetical protein
MDHMRLEAPIILPQAILHLTETEWLELDAAVKENADPLNGKYARDPV